MKSIFVTVGISNGGTVLGVNRMKQMVNFWGQCLNKEKPANRIFTGNYTSLPANIEQKDKIENASF